MPGQRRVSARQLELLVEFAESNPDIALGRFPGGPQAVRVSREVWNSIAVQLNSVAEGTSKSPEQWRRYWIEFKAKTKGKAADSRRNAAATGGGPNRLMALTELEQRVLAILGPVAVEGLPGVRLPSNILNELPASQTMTAQSTLPQPSTPEQSSLEPLMDVEWLEDEIPSPLRLQPESQAHDFPPPLSTQPALPPSPSLQPALPPSPSSLPALPPSSTETLDTQQQPQDTQREHRHAQRSTSPPPSRTAQRGRKRSRRQMHLDENVPRWAYDLELRRLANEERQTENDARRVVNEERQTENDARRLTLLEQIFNVLTKISDRYVPQSPV